MVSQKEVWLTLNWRTSLEHIPVALELLLEGQLYLVPLLRVLFQDTLELFCSAQAPGFCITSSGPPRLCGIPFSLVAPIFLLQSNL